MADVTEALLAKIEAHAREAQGVDPGPWVHVAVRFMQHEVHSKVPSEEGYEAALCSHSVTAEHIATCSPDVVLALVERIRELDADLTQLKTDIESAAASRRFEDR